MASCLLILVSVASVLAVRISTAEAGSSGVWSAAANLITGREEHTATLLQNGTVLVAGGTDGRGNALANAELYNPKANRWMSAGTMATTRLDHTATLLPTGKVLVVGGLDASFPSSTLASTELYDPKTNSWSAAASMSIGRARHTATGLLDGRVLVVGGLSVTLRDGGLFPNQSVGAEIYDPAINRWSPTGPMSLDRLDHTATLLRDGRVLVTGGQDGFTASRSAEIFDPGQNRWFTGASMTNGRDGQTDTLLPNGDVLLIGGLGPETASPYGGQPGGHLRRLRSSSRPLVAYRQHVGAADRTHGYVIAQRNRTGRGQCRAGNVSSRGVLPDAQLVVQHQRADAPLSPYGDAVTRWKGPGRWGIRDRVPRQRSSV